MRALPAEALQASVGSVGVEMPFSLPTLLGGRFVADPGSLTSGPIRVEVSDLQIQTEDIPPDSRQIFDATQWVRGYSFTWTISCAPEGCPP